MVLPPKFFFPTYRRYLLSQPGLDHILNNVDVKPFQKYDFVTKAPPRPEQQECVDLAESELKNKKYFKGIIQAPPGWGKAVYNEILLETPCGNIKMGDIREGDMVFGRDGKPTKVLRVYPQGKVKLYKFTFGDTSSTIVSGDHLWTVWNTDIRKWQDLTTNEIMSKNYARPEKDKRYGDKSNGMRYKYFIPLCKPVEYNFDISDPSKNTYAAGNAQQGMTKSLKLAYDQNKNNVIINISYGQQKVFIPVKDLQDAKGLGWSLINAGNVADLKLAEYMMAHNIKTEIPDEVPGHITSQEQQIPMQGMPPQGQPQYQQPMPQYQQAPYQG